MVFEIKSAFAGHYLRTVLLLLFALLSGPVLFWFVYERAMSNNVDGFASWAAILVFLLCCGYMSVRVFLYVWFVLFGGYVIEINEYNKTLEIYPDKHVIYLKLVTEVVYLRSQRRYVFRCDSPGCEVYSIEINRDMHLENEVIRLTAIQNCKVE